MMDRHPVFAAERNDEISTTFTTRSSKTMAQYAAFKITSKLTLNEARKCLIIFEEIMHQECDALQGQVVQSQLTESALDFYAPNPF